MVEIAVEKITPSEIVPERLVLSRMAPESAVETTTPADVVVESADEATVAVEVWVDLAVLDDDEIAVLSESPVETWVVCEFSADSALDSVVDIELLVPRVVDTELVRVRLLPSTALSTLVVG